MVSLKRQFQTLLLYSRQCWGMPTIPEMQNVPCYTDAKEVVRLEGPHLSEKSAWGAFRPCLPSRHAASALLLVLFLLTPYGPSFLVLFGGDGSSCGMQCCKQSKGCCCRKSGHDLHRGGAAWASASTCPGGCRQAPAIQGTAAASLSATRFETVPVVDVSPALPLPEPVRRSSDVAFALFERPPPGA